MSSQDLLNFLDQASSTSERLLYLLKMRGDMQASEAAAILGISAEAARQHFVKLAQSQRVEAYSQIQGVGRPNQFWRLTVQGHANFPNRHADLAVQLLEDFKESLGSEGLEQLVRQRKLRMEQRYLEALDSLDTLEARLQKLTQLRSDEGYMAEYHVQEDGDFLFIENHCPICAAAQVCPSFCSAEQRLLEKVLGTQVLRSEHIIQDQRRCAYLVKAWPKD